MEEPRDCSFCSPINQYIQTDNPNADPLQLGSGQDLTNSAKDCGICGILHAQLKGTRPTIDPTTQLEVYCQPEADTDFQISSESSDGEYYLALAPLKRRDPNRSVGTITSQQWLDVDKAKGWLHFCERVHSAQCKPIDVPHPSAIIDRDQFLVVDTMRGCLAELPSGEPYIALSYVWGAPSGITRRLAQLTMGNRDELLRMGSLRPSDDACDLSKTLVDALLFTQAIGLRYLWVDRLCVVQDSDGHKATLIPRMGNIYAHAHITLIAASGTDSDAGLPGTNSTPFTRGPQTLIPFVGNPCIVQRKGWEAIGTSHWKQRAWTFQEKLLSRRVMVFTETGVFWYCRHNMWSEDLSGDPEKHPRPDLRLMGMIELYEPAAWPDLFQWRGLVNMYNRRSLSYERDRLAAFVGLESGLRLGFPNAFISGMPEAFFDIALLWQPLSPMLRRTLRTRDELQLPTWSWTGWHGYIDPRSLIRGADHIAIDAEGQRHPETSVRTYPLVQWYAISDSTQDRIIIKEEYHEWRTKPTDDVLWTQETDSEGRTTFSHPKTAPAAFHYPIPLGPYVHEPLRDSLLSAVSRIACWTTSATLFAGEPLPKLHSISCATVTLLDSMARWTGCLRLNTADSTSVPPGSVCELIAISEGSAENRRDESYWFEEWSAKELSTNEPYYKFYNVMWVTKHDGYMERVANGRVEKTCWERQQLQRIYVELR